MARYEIVATSVTFEQENLISPIMLSFRTTQRASVEKGISLSNHFLSDPMVLWRDYLIGSYVKAQHRTHGLFLWSMSEKSIFYFEVCHSVFPSPGALNPNSRQMKSFSQSTKVVDDVLFVGLGVSRGTHHHPAFCCIHMPSLVISTPLLGEHLSVTRNAVGVLLPKFINGSHETASYCLGRTTIYSIPAHSPTHPRYCFITTRALGHPSERSLGVKWEVFEMEVDLSTPGPIKIFSKLSWKYRVEHPIKLSHDSDHDLFLYPPLQRGGRPSVRFLRVGNLDTWRWARLGGVDRMHLTGMWVDKDAGYVIAHGDEAWRQSTRDCAFIWWFDVRKPGNMVYSRTKELISSWGRGLKWGF